MKTCNITNLPQLHDTQTLLQPIQKQLDAMGKNLRWAADRKTWQASRQDEIYDRLSTDCAKTLIISKCRRIWNISKGKQIEHI